MARPLLRRRRLAAILAAAPLTLPAACAPARPSAAPVPRRLFVASAGSRIVAVVDLDSPRAPCVAVRLEGVPIRLASGPAGAFLVAHTLDNRDTTISHVTPDDPRHSAWSQRPVTVGSAATASVELLLASDHRRHAVAVRTRHDGHAPLDTYAVLDWRSGRATCAPIRLPPGDTVRAVAVHPSPSGPLVYTATERLPGYGSAARAIPGQIRAASAAGETVAAAHLEGVPVDLAIGPGPEGDGSAVYCLEHYVDGTAAMSPTAAVVILDAPALTPLARITLDAAPTHLCVPPAGYALYLLAQDTLLQVDAARGTVVRTVRLPGRALALAAAANHVYVAGAYTEEVWVLDRRTGARLDSIPTGPGPVALSLSS